MKVALCLRGHIRDGLIDNGLRVLIDFLKGCGFEIDLYMHTWHESEAKSSYRNVDRSCVFQVSENFLRFYFKEHSIKEIIIEDDSNIQLVGKVDGQVCMSSCPLIAWKRMWHGKYTLINAVKKSKTRYDCVINTRYDIFTHNLCKIPKQKILRLAKQPAALNFLYPNLTRQIIGVDNIYCGSLSAMAKLSHAFHHDLDRIMLKYPNTLHQEELVYKYAKDKKFIDCA